MSFIIQGVAIMAIAWFGSKALETEWNHFWLMNVMLALILFALGLVLESIKDLLKDIRSTSPTS